MIPTEKAMLVLILICLAVGNLATGNPVLETFYLNKKSQLESRPISQYEGRECAHSMGKQIILTEQFTLCYRHQPMIFNYRSGVFSFGRIDSSWSNLEVGFVYVNFDSGTWIGFVEGLNPIAWMPLGLHQFTTQVWRHSCIAFDFKKTTLQLYENGKKMHERKFELLKDIYSTIKMDMNMNIFTIGCAYIDSLDEDWTYAASMLGRYTDLQVFGRILSKKDMEDITGCRKVIQGDLVSWEQDEWFLNGTKKTSEVERLRFEGDICKDLSTSFHLVPFTVKGLEFGGVEVCSKLSGDVAE